MSRIARIVVPGLPHHGFAIRDSHLFIPAIISRTLEHSSHSFGMTTLPIVRVLGLCHEPP
jgi:hypothetical protein